MGEVISPHLFFHLNRHIPCSKQDAVKMQDSGLLASFLIMSLLGLNTQALANCQEIMQLQAALASAGTKSDITEVYFNLIERLTQKGALNDSTLARIEGADSFIDPLPLVVANRLKAEEVGAFKGAITQLKAALNRGASFKTEVLKEKVNVLRGKTHEGQKTREQINNETRFIFLPGEEKLLARWPSINGKIADFDSHAAKDGSIVVAVEYEMHPHREESNNVLILWNSRSTGFSSSVDFLAYEKPLAGPEHVAGFRFFETEEGVFLNLFGTGERFRGQVLKATPPLHTVPRNPRYRAFETDPKATNLRRSHIYQHSADELYAFGRLKDKDEFVVSLFGSPRPYEMHIKDPDTKVVRGSTMTVFEMIKTRQDVLYLAAHTSDTVQIYSPALKTPLTHKVDIQNSSKLGFFETPDGGIYWIADGAKYSGEKSKPLERWITVVDVKAGTVREIELGSGYETDSQEAVHTKQGHTFIVATKTVKRWPEKLAFIHLQSGFPYVVDLPPDTVGYLKTIETEDGRLDAYVATKNGIVRLQVYGRINN